MKKLLAAAVSLAMVFTLGFSAVAVSAGDVMDTSAHDYWKDNGQGVTYNYISADDLKKDINSKNPQYTIIDARYYADETGYMEDFGYPAFSSGHIMRSLSAPVVDNEYDSYTVGEVISNLKGAGVTENSNGKYVLVCFYGGELAETESLIMSSLMGISQDNLFILTDGYSQDTDWDDEPDAGFAPANPDYCVTTGTSKGGMSYNGVTPEQLSNGIDEKAGAYSVIVDTRETKDYNEGHIVGAKAAAVPNADASSAEAKSNFQKLVSENGTGAVYTVVCYSGNGYADAATRLLMANGVPEKNIIRLVGGHTAFAAAYPDKIVKDEPKPDDGGKDKDKGKDKNKGDEVKPVDTSDNSAIFTYAGFGLASIFAIIALITARRKKIS